MTRINLVPVQELTDQHLFAEFREIKMVPKSLRRSLQAAWQREFDKNDSNDFSEERRRLAVAAVLKRIPAQFTLGTGHVSFFYDKGAYLSNRFLELREELARRGVNFDRSSKLDSAGVYAEVPITFFKNYTPTPEALILIRERIAEKIAMKPDWYRYEGRMRACLQPN